MPLSDECKEKLHTVEPRLAALVQRIAAEFDLKVLEGARTKERQEKLVKEGKSKTLNSKHIPGDDGWSHAVDIAPKPINWDYAEPYYFLAGRMLQLAMDSGLKIRWGGDWNMNQKFDDERFRDLVHFELVD